MTTHHRIHRATWARTFAATALLAALLVAAPAAAAGPPRLRSLPRAFPVASPIVDSQGRAPLDVPGYRGLESRWYGTYEFAVMCAVLAGVDAILGLAFTGYALEQGDPAWSGAAAIAFSAAGAWGTAGTVAGATVERHRAPIHVQVGGTQGGAALEVGPGRVSLQF